MLQGKSMRDSIRPGTLPARRAGARRILCSGVALSILAAAAAVPAQTIVPNAHLNTALAPWTTFLSAAPDAVGSGAAPVWMAVDVAGSAASGSAQIVLDSSATPRNAASGVGQCVDFSAATSVAFLNYGMAFQVPPATPVDGSVRATVEIRLFANAGCSGFIGGGMQGQVLMAPAVQASTWYRLADNSFVPPGAPVMAASAEVRGYLRQTGTVQTAAPFAVNVDHFVLVLNSTTPVELIRFNVD